jgi:c-di-GMP-binding flagellar brake protein YcgR
MIVLTDLVKKVDRILEVLNHNRASENACQPSYETATCIDLSGGGMLLRSPRCLTTGELLEVLVPLPTASPATVRILATVVRESKATDSLQDTAVTFSTINDEDREQIIAYVFQRERHILAAQRGLSQSQL